jgi:hypothetical protein
MKQIQPFQVWVNGVYKVAIYLQLHCNYDNLVDSAVFYYSLKDESSNLLVEGNITMSGVDYTTYSSSPTSNDFAFSWAAQTLNLILV